MFGPRTATAMVVFLLGCLHVALFLLRRVAAAPRLVFAANANVYWCMERVICSCSLLRGWCNFPFF
jgi:hypothetical protein